MYALHDVPHILKNVRNNLKKQDIKYGNGKVVYIVHCYKLQFVIDYCKYTVTLTTLPIVWPCIDSSVLFCLLCSTFLLECSSTALLNERWCTVILVDVKMYVFKILTTRLARNIVIFKPFNEKHVSVIIV